MAMGIVWDSDGSQVLASKIHDSTEGLSTAADAHETICSIQRVQIYGSLFLRWLFLVSWKRDIWRSPVKLFSLLKIPAMIFGFGVLAVFAPSCKAQSEVSPDHFDGTDSWEIAARKPVAAKGKHAPTTGSYQDQNKKTPAGATLHLASSRDTLTPIPHDALPLQHQLKAT